MLGKLLCCSLLHFAICCLLPFAMLFSANWQRYSHQLAPILLRQGLSQRRLLLLVCAIILSMVCGVHGDNELTLCVDGFYREHSACVECPLHYICFNESRRAVAEFDPGLRTLAQCTVFLQDTVCAPSMFRTSRTDMCKPCPRDFFCPSEHEIGLPNVMRCPENQFTYNTGAESSSECVTQACYHESQPALKVSFNRPRPRSQPARAGRACVGCLFFFVVYFFHYCS